jgi:hypothetical protein
VAQQESARSKVSSGVEQNFCGAIGNQSRFKMRIVPL